MQGEWTREGKVHHLCLIASPLQPSRDSQTPADSYLHAAACLRLADVLYIYRHTYNIPGELTGRHRGERSEVLVGAQLEPALEARTEK